MVQTWVARGHPFSVTIVPLVITGVFLFDILQKGLVARGQSNRMYMVPNENNGRKVMNPKEMRR